MTPSVAFVIPTRNRADLAARAASALLDDGGRELTVVVSDNSTDAEQAEQLAAACRDRGDARLLYLRAPELTMPAHWDWALEQTLERSDAEHVSVHYDRKIVKPGGLRHLLDAVDRHPGRVITYLVDQVVAQPGGYALWQTPWTGEAYAVETARVLRMASQGRIAAMGQSFPVLSNCTVPRGVLERIRHRFGDICDSTGPDAAFTFRFCALEDGYVHLDRTLALIYASTRSNGAGYLSGRPTDFVDFKRSWGDRAWLDAVPIQGVDLGWNMLFHEYELVRREVGDPFPPLSREGYLDGLAYGLDQIEDPRRRAEHEALLVRHGWRRPPAGSARVAPERSRLGPRLRRLATPGGAARAVAVRGAGKTGRQAVVLRLARRPGLRPESITGFTFTTEGAALRAATRVPRRRVAHHEWLDWLR